MSDQKANEILSVGMAFKLWRQFGLTSPNELILEDIAFARGVLVIDGPLDSAEARLIRNGERGLIRVRDSIPESGRRRFAIAHELGHWEMHRHLSQLAVCTTDDMVASYKASTPEIEANLFAAELLMPTKLFGPRIEKAVPSFSLMADLAAFFDTSLTATALRFVDLTSEACAFVVSENKTIKWWRKSKTFSYWLKAGNSLPSTSIAYRYFCGQPVPSEPQELAVGNWIESSVSSAEEPMCEQVVVFDRYKQTASFLWLH